MAKLITILKLVATVAAAFNLNNIQEKELEDYAKLNQNAWVEKREHDIEIALSEQAKIISK